MTQSYSTVSEGDHKLPLIIVMVISSSNGGMIEIAVGDKFCFSFNVWVKSFERI